MASEAAKQALLGEDVFIVNAEKAYVSGDMKAVFREKRAKLDIKNKGNRLGGPFHQRRPDRFVRRTVRGMLPWKRQRGREAYKRVRVYIGVPEDELKKHNVAKVPDAKHKKKLRRKVTVAEICSHLGGSW